MRGGFGKPKGRRRWPEFVRKERLEVRTIPLREETIRKKSHGQLLSDHA